MAEDEAAVVVEGAALLEEVQKDQAEQGRQRDVVAGLLVLRAVLELGRQGLEGLAKAIEELTGDALLVEHRLDVAADRAARVGRIGIDEVVDPELDPLAEPDRIGRGGGGLHATEVHVPVAVSGGTFVP